MFVDPPSFRTVTSQDVVLRAVTEQLKLVRVMVAWMSGVLGNRPLGNVNVTTSVSPEATVTESLAQ